MLSRRIQRRSILKGGALAPLLYIGSVANLKGQEASSGLTFSPIQGSPDDEITVPEGYKWEPLAAWGQPINGSAPEFDPYDLDPWAQEQQVGYNCDFVVWFDYIGGSGVVGINHEYTNPELMFSNHSADHATTRQVDYEIAAHGVSMLSVVRRPAAQGGGYRHYPHNILNRRIHGETRIFLTGPVAGHALLRTSSDPYGTTVNGTFNTCGGGVTTWGPI